MKTYHVYTKEGNTFLRAVKCLEEFIDFQYDKNIEYIVEVT